MNERNVLTQEILQLELFLVGSFESSSCVAIVRDSDLVTSLTYSTILRWLSVRDYAAGLVPCCVSSSLCQLSEMK